MIKLRGTPSDRRRSESGIFFSVCQDGHDILRLINGKLSFSHYFAFGITHSRTWDASGPSSGSFNYNSPPPCCVPPSLNGIERKISDISLLDKFSSLNLTDTTNCRGPPKLGTAANQPELSSEISCTVSRIIGYFILQARLRPEIFPDTFPQTVENLLKCPQLHFSPYR